MKPNIIYIHSHDTGRYIQPYGHAVATPNLQRLAEEGVLFRQNFCVNPTCSPSRAALLTGSYPHENGMLGLAHRGFSLHDYQQHLLHTLRKAGYISVQTGVQHIAAEDGEKEPWQISGYDDHVGNKHCGHDGAVAFLSAPPDEPFFLAVGFSETHRVFPPLEDSPDDARYCLPPAPLPDTKETREDMVRYKASARILDQKIGDVLDALEKSGKADNTLVICTTDHGIAFPHMKCNLTDHGIGVLLIMRGPAGFNGGKVVDAMVSHLDLFPTICELIDIPQPDWLRGSSLIPLVDDTASSLHDALFFEVNYHAAYEPMRAVRTERWKYIRRFADRRKPVLANCDNGESKSFLLDQDWTSRVLEQEFLYDLYFDPNEVSNQVDNPAFRHILENMRTRLDRWMEETDDPLRFGFVAAPDGAVINDPDDISPKTPRKR
jgi:arylsulfatase A-like enzyme